GSIAGILISFFYLSFLFPYSIALTAAATGMAMEYLPIEDNYTIPIATGFALMLLI
ncbi:MAG: phosphatidate cytidylyltransferase, partial [Candidatus Diapherotrites archaeon CG_4_10_14_0_2_um_filter_31_5]